MMSLINTKSHCWGPCTVDVSILRDAQKVEQRVRCHGLIDPSYMPSRASRLFKRIVDS